MNDQSSLNWMINAVNSNKIDQTIAHFFIRTLSLLTNIFQKHVTTEGLK